jgi:RHS repeat-associated protein
MTDNITNLQWNINRWYDAKVGRWCSEDPMEFDAREMNLVRYVVNGPLIYKDFHGLWNGQLKMIYIFL